VDRAPGLTVHRLRPDEVALLRTLRLRALADAPDAFGETLDDISAKPPEYWDVRARSLTTPGRHVMFLVETAAGTPGEIRGVGMAFGIRDTQRTDVARVGGMWVDPAHRRDGAGQLLTEAVIGWARQEAFRVLELWVADGNERAAKLYERCGFAATGARRPLPSNPTRGTIEMAREL
jgi:GNAT superfamily N-acetyltransferase